MFIRVRSKLTGHEFDIHESRFNEAKHTKVDRRKYPPAKAPRRSKFRVRLPRARSVSAVKVEEEVGNVADDS